MPTPIPLPASCSVDALAEWLRRTVDSDRGNPYYAMAEVVRALVDAKVREAIDHARIGTRPHRASSIVQSPVENIVARILGAS